MGRSQESFQKKEVRKKKEKKRQDKEKKRLERKDQARSSNFDDMIAYVDENGILSSTPPDQTKKSTTKAADIEVSIPKRDPNEPGHNVSSGKLAFFNEIKGYGFINENGTGQSIFVHINDFQDEINKGDHVSFEIGSGQRGPAAFNVKLQK